MDDCNSTYLNRSIPTLSYLILSLPVSNYLQYIHWDSQVSIRTIRTFPCLYVYATVSWEMGPCLPLPFRRTTLHKSSLVFVAFMMFLICDRGAWLLSENKGNTFTKWLAVPKDWNYVWRMKALTLIPETSGKKKHNYISETCKKKNNTSPPEKTCPCSLASNHLQNR